MKFNKWNEGWKYWIDRDSFAMVWSVPETAETVCLPHDAMLACPAFAESKSGANTGYRDGDIYTYVKTLYVPQSCKGETLKLKFEGAYMNTFVYVNEQLAAKNPFGYSAFLVDLEPYIRYDAENEIRVKVYAGAAPNSRWYSGAGIYRDVWLLSGPETYICPDEVKITTENIYADYAVISVSAVIHNRCSQKKNVILEHRLLDDDGNAAGAESCRAVLMAGQRLTVKRRIIVKNPKLWDDTAPWLYRCVSRLWAIEENADDAKAEVPGAVSDKDAALSADCHEEFFGIRQITMDARDGFKINGRSVKLRGACIHHDSGLLGAATYEDAHIRQISRLKAAGFNAVRMAHNPMAEPLLRACDRLGVYVMDEAFDMWNRLKSNYDYGLYFKEWWESDLMAMVKKDYNHPSVIMYSVGNEIPEIGTDQGFDLCHELCEKVRMLDDSRYVTAAINGAFAAGKELGCIIGDILKNNKSNEIDGVHESSDCHKPDTQRTEASQEGNVNEFMTAMDAHLDEIVQHKVISEILERACTCLDVAGYNYMAARYKGDGKAYPNRVIVGSETYPPDIAKNWALVQELPYVIGDFTWTGWDYIGEAGVGICGYTPGEGGFGALFPAQLAYCGDIDIIGDRRPASYYREIVFEQRHAPYIAVQDPNRYGQKLLKTPWMISDALSSWTWRGCEGNPVIIEVYSGGDETELFLNGRSLGRKTAGKDAGYRVLYETVYEPGVLTAITYTQGQESGRYSLETTEDVCDIQVECEAPGNLLQYINIELRDACGRLVMDSDRRLWVKVTGNAQLLGFGSADPKPLDNYNGDTARTYHGRAQIILKRGNEGKACVTVSDHGTLSAAVEISMEGDMSWNH